MEIIMLKSFLEFEAEEQRVEQQEGVCGAATNEQKEWFLQKILQKKLRVKNVYNFDVKSVISTCGGRVRLCAA